MTENETTLTTAQYSEKTGIAVATVARMLRQGKLRGEKRDGKWAIFASDLLDAGVATKTSGNQAAASSDPVVKAPPGQGKTYDVESFARLTYLTETGVRQWLRSGRLSGSTDSSGNPRVDASNLARLEFKHLVRD